MSDRGDFFLGSGRQHNPEIEYLFSQPDHFSPSGVEKRNAAPKFVRERQELDLAVVQPLSRESEEQEYQSPCQEKSQQSFEGRPLESYR
mmetsp:Transcript_27327/g.33985  ORF Transcript_27327/g.33985 Transcript_27327/m.33985 type:complete len:89 (-) Transcript_27327:310-576(-)